MRKLLVEILACLSLAACAVQPATHADLPATVTATAPAAWSVDVPRDPADPAAWWTQFGDPVLHELVASVLNDNLDLQAAVERVKQAQALTTQRRAALLPQLDANAGASDARQNTPPPLGYVRQAGSACRRAGRPMCSAASGWNCWRRRRNSSDANMPPISCGSRSRPIRRRRMSICAGRKRN